jgi:lactoylglutathione lyase
MIIDHVAIWTSNLEQLKNYYTKYFNGKAGEKYLNKETKFESYFVSFESGTRIELMNMPDISLNGISQPGMKHQGLTHLAFGVENMEQVLEKARELENNGFTILRGPRKTGDGYFEFETSDPDNNRIEVATRFVE